MFLREHNPSLPRSPPLPRYPIPISSSPRPLARAPALSPALPSPPPFTNPKAQRSQHTTNLLPRAHKRKTFEALAAGRPNPLKRCLILAKKMAPRGHRSCIPSQTNVRIAVGRLMIKCEAFSRRVYCEVVASYDTISKRRHSLGSKVGPCTGDSVTALVYRS